EPRERHRDARARPALRLPVAAGGAAGQHAPRLVEAVGEARLDVVAVAARDLALLDGALVAGLLRHGEGALEELVRLGPVPVGHRASGVRGANSRGRSPCTMRRRIWSKSPIAKPPFFAGTRRPK